MKGTGPLNFIVVLLLSFCSGCAFGTRNFALGYQVGSPPGAPKDVNIYVAPFKDERTEKDVVGHVRNAYGMKTAKIITSSSVGEWVTEALKAELKNMGYDITENSDANIKVGGEVITVYVTSLMMYEGKVAMEVSLTMDNREIFTRKYEGTNESVNFASRAKSYGKMLEQSLQKATTEAVHDIDRAVSKKTGSE